MYFLNGQHLLFWRFGRRKILCGRGLLALQGRFDPRSLQAEDTGPILKSSVPWAWQPQVHSASFQRTELNEKTLEMAPSTRATPHSSSRIPGRPSTNSN